MFGVHRQNRCTVLLCQFINQFSRHDQRFLIRQCNGFLCPNRIHGRFQSGVADHRRQYHINRPGLHYLADGVSSRVYLYRQVAQSFFQFGIFLFVGYHDNFRLKLPRLSYQQLHTIVGRQRVCLVQIGMFLYHLQCLCADRPGRA